MMLTCEAIGYRITFCIEIMHHGVLPDGASSEINNVSV